MITPWIILVTLSLGQHAPTAVGTVEGIVVNGSAHETPMAEAEVVLRVGDGTQFIPVETTTTDARGYFVFRELPTDPQLIYLAGTNRAGVHYPGPRLRLDETHPQSQVRLVAYEAIENPSPLVITDHNIHIRTERGVLDITESLVIMNPSINAYVGQSDVMETPVTFRLSLPDGFETVTFADEFHGRNFQVIDGKVVTTLPWPPGKRDLKIMYRLPIESRNRELVRTIDLPTTNLVVQTDGKLSGSVSCNLPRKSSESNGVQFTSSEPIAGGYELRVNFGSLPISADALARWCACAVLACLVSVVLGVVWTGRKKT